jgi:hypothetical protein
MRLRCASVEDWLGSYDDYAVEPEEILDLGNGVTFAVTHQERRPVGSPDGALVVETWAYVRSPRPPWWS